MENKHRARAQRVITRFPPGRSHTNLHTATFARMHRGAYLVGVAGGSGSGKTSLVRALRDRLPPGSVCLISQDDYYLPLSQQAVDPNGRVNFDLPTGIDLNALVRDLQLLVAGDTLVRTEYTFNQEEKQPSVIEIAPAPIVLVEGLFVLHHAPLRELFDLRVFIEAHEDTQLQRRLQRDELERGYGSEEVRYQWDNHVMPAYREFLLPYRHHCDLHVVNEVDLNRAATVLADHLNQAALKVAPLSLQSL